MSPDNNSKKVRLITLGCRLNFFETDGIFSGLKTEGYSLAASGERADEVIINTCTVTNKADSKNRNIIRKAIAANPDARVWVTGCYAQTDRAVIEKIPGIAGVIGNADKSGLAAMILGNPRTLSDRFSYSNVMPEGHTRAYLKIQDGCDRSCSYCKIPAARGKGNSRNSDAILEQVRFLQDKGVGEIVLTGVNIGWYKKENKKSLPWLLESILDLLDYSRLRISSIEPPDVGRELAELFQHPRFCNYLHIPLQSGSKKILKRMKRSYFPETFLARTRMVREKNPEIFIGTDVITGFPGETEEDFQDSIRVIEEAGIVKIHAFPFSERKGTVAESLEGRVDVPLRKHRVRILNSLSDRYWQQYSTRMFGKTFQAIHENDGTLVTDNYLKIRLQQSQQQLAPGQFVDVTPVAMGDDGYLLGKL